MEIILQSQNALERNTFDMNGEIITRKHSKMESLSRQKDGGKGSSENQPPSVSDRIFGLARDEVEPQFREAFILTGYRRPNIQALDCIKSVFLPDCNECINVWSHFIAFLLFVLKFYNLYSSKYSITDPFTWPLLSFGIGICGFCLISSVAHMFNSMSTNTRHSCFFMDYAAISVYSVGAGQAFYFYCRPLSPSLWILHSSNMFLLVSIIVSISSTLLCCLSRHHWQNTKYVIRTTSFFAPYFVNSFPYLYRMFYCSSDIDCRITESMPMFKVHCIFYLLSAVVNMLRFPERLFPGTFDFFGHSHHYLHIFTALGAAYQFDAIHLDMDIRMNYLKEESIKITFWNSVALMLVAVVINFGIALFFGIRNSRKSNKINLEKKQ